MGWWELLAQGISDTVNIGASLYTDHKNRESIAKANKQNLDYQKEFAQNGITWRVQDAVKAGLHPLAALGAQTTSFSPSFVPGDYSRTGEALSRAGQNIGNYLKGMFNKKAERQADLEMQLLEEEVKTKKLDRILKASGFGDSPNVIGNLSKNDQLLNEQNATNVVMKPHEITKSVQTGVSAGVNPLEDRYIDDEKYIWQTINQNLGDTLESSYYDQAKYIWYRTVKLGKSIFYYYNPGAKGAKDHRAYIREIRPQVPDNLRSKYEFRFDPYRGFRLHKKRDSSDSQLYVDNPKSKAVIYKKDGKTYGRGKISNLTN